MMIGGLYGCDKYCKRVGSFDDSSAVYVSDWAIDGNGVSLIVFLEFDTALTYGLRTSDQRLPSQGFLTCP